MVLAPFTPFLAEELFQKLTGGESVHLLDWHAAGHVNELVIRDMAATRAAISSGLAQRAEGGIKVRQPLAKATVVNAFNIGETADTYAEYLEIIREELNVKEVVCADGEAGAAPHAILDLAITPELRREGLAREVIRHVQQARKAAGLEVDDRIHLAFTTEDAELRKLLDGDSELTALILRETLAVPLAKGAEQPSGYVAGVKVDGRPLEIRLARA
jgi:isoleucyl-tRNA synthetase